MPRAKEAEKKSRSRRQLITPASRARITRIVCQGRCRHCRQFPDRCACGNYQADHSYRGSRRGIDIRINLADQPDQDGLRVRYRVQFPALGSKDGAGPHVGPEDLIGTAGTVFDAIQRIQLKYERRQLRR